MAVSWHVPVGLVWGGFSDLYPGIAFTAGQIPYFDQPIFPTNVPTIAQYRSGYVWLNDVNCRPVSGPEGTSGGHSIHVGTLPSKVIGLRVAIGRTGPVSGANLVVDVWYTTISAALTDWSLIPPIGRITYPLSSLPLMNPADNYVLYAPQTTPSSQSFPYTELLFPSPIPVYLSDFDPINNPWITNNLLFAIYVGSGFVPEPNLVIGHGGEFSYTGNSLLSNGLGSNYWPFFWDRPNTSRLNPVSQPESKGIQWAIGIDPDPVVHGRSSVQFIG